MAQTPTPLQPLDRLSEQLSGPRIWIKRDDLTGAATSGNKVRKLEFLLADAKAKGCDTLITSGGTQSNHCRAVAILGAQLGLKVHLLLRADCAPELTGNLLLSTLAGAEISHFSREEFRQLQDLESRCVEQHQQRGCKPYLIPVGGSNGTGAWGYLRACEELKADFSAAGIKPQAIVHATGSGGTQAGLTLGSALHGLNVPVQGYAVCDNARYFADKVVADMAEWQRIYNAPLNVSELTVTTNDNHCGPGYSIATPQIFDTIKTVARTEGIFLDPVYSGKAFHGLVEEIRAGTYGGSDVVFIHTGGLFGLLAQREQLGLA